MKLIKTLLLVILVVILVFSLLEISSQNPSSIARDLVKNRKLDSPELNLRLYYLSVIPLADARITELGKEKFRKQDLIHIRAQTKTFDYVKSIFYARARVDSYLDPKNLNAVYFLHHLEMINKPEEDKEIWYDQKRHLMRYEGPRGIEKLVIDKDTFDPLSAFFYFRNTSLPIGQEFSLNLNTNQKNYILTGKFVEQKSVRIKDKEYQMLLLTARVQRKNKTPRHSFTLNIWFLDHAGKRVPILVKAMTNIGPIVAKAR